jgi:hypothetical protein
MGTVESFCMRAEAIISFVCTNQIQYNTLHVICHLSSALLLVSKI